LRSIRLMMLLSLVAACIASVDCLAVGAVPYSLYRLRHAALHMNEPPMTDYEAYMKARNAGTVQGGSIDEAMAGIKQFEKYDLDFDGGDSGGGVVGDGNTDLEDQHNSASVVRGLGNVAAAVGLGGTNVGRGQVKSATDSRVASAGKNYFGRSTGYADKLIEEISEEDLKNHRMDRVRAQQKENWFNQRAIHAQNKAQGQGVVFGERKAGGHYIAREALSSETWQQGAHENEISQHDLANHLEKLRTVPAQRLDGEEWGALVISADDPIEQTFEISSAIRQTAITEIDVQNMYNTFAPFRVLFTTDSSPDFTVTPTCGTMNRRSGDPIHLVVRFTPKNYGEASTACLVLETEDFKKIWKFIGST